MPRKFNPQRKYAVYPDYKETGGKVVLADEVSVTEGGALVFSCRGDDGNMYMTEVISPHNYTYFVWAGD